MDETVRETVEEERPLTNTLQTIAAQQVEYIVVATNTFTSTMVTVLSSAAGLVAALAWNVALSHWLRTIIPLDDRLGQDFAYAGVATLVAAVTIGVLGVVNSRFKVKNPLRRVLLERVEQPEK